MFEDFEFDIKAVVISLIFSAMFIGMIWMIPTWQTSAYFTFRKKLMMSVIIVPVLYVICIWQMNK